MKFKITKIISFTTYIVLIFILQSKNEQLSMAYSLPEWIIPTIFFGSLIYIFYRYIFFSIKEGSLEKEVISIVNHSFRTPLTSSLWYAKELEKDLPQNKRLSYLQNLDNSINKILGVVDVLTGIKDVKNISGYYFEAISLREIIEKSIRKYRDQINNKSLIFEVSIFNNIPLLTVDLKKIIFVIDTIVENAILYTPKNGKILINCTSNQHKITLFINDTGIGLGPIEKVMIFSKFYRSEKAKKLNTDGLGLRLYLSKIIIKKHRGYLYVKSNGLDEGSTFFIELPFVKQTKILIIQKIFYKILKLLKSY